MYRRTMRLALVLLAGLALHACRDAEGPLAPPSDVANPTLAVVDASTGGNPGVLFLPPLRPLGTRAGAFDPSVPLRFEVRLGGAGAVSHFSVASGDVTVQADHYLLEWRVPDAAAPGDVFEIRAFALTLELGRVDVEIAEPGRDMVRIRNAGDNVAVQDAPRALPVRLWLNTGAVAFAEAEAEEAAEGDSQEILDADVEVLSNETGGSVSVFDTQDDEAPLAGELTVDPNDVVDADGEPVDFYVLSLFHLAKDTKPSDDVAADQQFPFILRATLTDALGNPLRFATGASLVLCQPADMEFNQDAPYFLPAVQASQQQIIKVDDGTTIALPTVYGAPECEGFEDEPVGVGLRDALSLDGLRRLARLGLSRVAGFVVAEPLRAGHGGLTTTKSIEDLSEFAGALLTDPSVSTAVVPDGEVGEPTVIEIQAMVTGSVAQTNGGDDVRVEVTGDNAATLTVGDGVVDHGDGTYTATYTPSDAGTDQVAVTIAHPLTGTHEHVSGSPFTSEVAHSGLARGTVADATEAPVPGVAVTLVDCTSYETGPDGHCVPGSFTLSTTTDASGLYSFAHLPVDGAYRVTADVAPAGYGGTTPSNHVVFLTAAAPEAVGLDFLAQPAGVTVSGTAFYSTTPLPGVTVELRLGPDVLQESTSGPDGAYALTDVAPGTYFVQTHPPAGYGAFGFGLTVAGSDVIRDLYVPKLMTLTSPERGSTVGTSPTFVWESLPEAASYSVFVRLDSDNTLVHTENGIPTPYVTPDLTLTDGQVYWWQVTAVNADGNAVGATSGLTTELLTFTVDATLPNTPVQIAPPDGSVFHHFPRTTTLQWQTVPGAVDYVLEREFCQPEGCDVLSTPYPDVVVTETSFTFDFVGAQPGRWRVKARDALGRESPVSPWWHFRYTV